MTQKGIERFVTARRRAKSAIRNRVAALMTALLFGVSGHSIAASYQDDTPARLPALPYDANALAVGDINGDTHADVVVAINGQPRILVNDGAGHFTDETATRLPALSGAFMGAVLVDITGDGRPELFLVNAAGQNRLLINNGSGIFTDQTAARLPVNNDVGMAVAAGDVNGDGFIDFVIANRGTRNRTLINDGSGVFTDQTAARLPDDTDQSYGVVLADLDGIGGLDIVFANVGGQDRIYINNLLGVFTDQTATRLPAVQNDSLHVVAADVNKDGKPDLVFAGGASGPRLLLNDGSGTFTAQALPAQAEYALRVAVGDVDFDGNPDIVVANAGQARVLLGNGAAAPSFTDVTATVLPVDTRRGTALALSDFDHDLDLDLVVAGNSGESRALLNVIPEPRVLIAVSPDYIEVGDNVTIDVTAFDEDGLAFTTVSVTDPDGVHTTVPLSGGTQGTGIYAVPANNAKAGAYDVAVLSQDNLGANVTRHASFVAQTADLTPPVVSISLLTPSPLLFGLPVEITVTATDDRTVTNVIMTVNGTPVPLDSSGHATYYTSALGLHTVAATATDQAGNVGNATSMNFTVVDDVAAPVVTVSATPNPVDITNPVAVHAAATDNVAVVSLAAKVTGPGTPPAGTPITLNGSGDGTYTPYVPGSYTVEATATDPKGNIGTNTATFIAQGIPDSQAPVVSLMVSPLNIKQGQSVSIQVNATDNILVSSKTLEINGTPVALDGSGHATYTPIALGDYTTIARATDPTGNQGTSTVVFHVVNPSGDNVFPTATITSPPNNGEVGRTMTVTGTANDNLAVAQYTLEISPMGEGNWTQFATGYSAVVGGTLGTLDTTSLRNGIYDIRLTVLDLNNNESQAIRVVAVNGTFNPGVFARTWTDLAVPVAGIPIKILRTYDTRDRATSGDFGYGWTIEIMQRGQYKNRIPLGEEWQVNSGGPFGVANCGSSSETGLHVTEIRISDTEFYQFASIISMTPHISSICEGTFSFQQVGGVPGAKLELVGVGNTIYNPAGTAEWYSDDFDFSEPFNPSTVRLTTIDGRIIDLNLNSGITRIADRNGNAINITTAGVTHTSGASIAFTRDGFGRITKMTDPSGKMINYAYNASGDLISVTDRAANTTQFTYLAGHYLDTVIDPDGHVLVANSYDASGRLVGQADDDGNFTEYAHDVDNGTETVTRSDGTIEILHYALNGKIDSVNKDGKQKTFTYDAAGNILTETDGLGHTRNFTWNANRQLTSETNGVGAVISYGYDANNQLNAITAQGKTVNFVYDANGNVTSTTDGNGATVQSFTYNAQGSPTQAVFGNATYNMTYNAAGLLSTRTGPNGAQTNYSYDANNNVSSVGQKRTDNGSAATETTTYLRDGNDRITALTDPRGFSVNLAYDAAGNMTSMTDKRGAVTTYEYDVRNNLTRTNYPDGTFELRGYNLDDHLTSVSNRLTNIADLLGNLTFYEYDGYGNMTKVTYPDGAVGTFVYDAAGRRTSETDPTNVVKSYEYDNANRPTKFTNAAGFRTYTYSGTGQKPVSVTDPLGRVTQFVYDNNLFGAERLASTTHADASVTSQTWGTGQRVATKTDELGHVTSYLYDGVGNVTRVTDAINGQTNYTYDEVGNRLTEVDAKNQTTTYRYDAMGNRTSRRLPGSQTETFTYDGNGNMLTHVDFKGLTTTYTYDSMNRVATETRPGGEVVTNTYAANGKIASSTISGSPARTWSYTYDSRNRLTKVTYPDLKTTTYSYDSADRRTQIVSPAGTTDYTYDAAGRLATVVDPNGHTTTYTYNAAGLPTQVDNANGTRTTYSYDLRDRPLVVTNLRPDLTTIITQHTYTYDANGKRLTMVEADGRSVTYTYDALNRLLSEVDGGVTTSYTYDAVGNRTQRNAGGTITNYSYNSNNQLTGATSASFSFDANGNQITQSITGVGNLTFTYDSQDRLVRITGTSPTVPQTDFVYDHSGNRVERNAGGTITKFVIDPNDPSGLAQLVAELSSGGSVDVGYVYGLSRLSKLAASGDRYYHPDALGSTRALSDGAGTKTDDYDYAAFGKTTATTGTDANPFRFAGEQFESNGGLYNLRARYMSPETGRFLTMDKFRPNVLDPLSLNRYLYASANPVNMIDPSGNQDLGSVMISISISATLATIAYNTFIKPVKEFYDTAKELLDEIPGMPLNKSTKRSDIGFTIPNSLSDAKDPANWVNAGDGSLGKAYKIVEKMNSDAGKWITQIHKWNATQFLRILPTVGSTVSAAPADQVPGDYLNCGFNGYVQKTFALQLVTALKAAKFLGDIPNIIGMYLAYITFLEFAGETLDEWGSGGVPPQPAGNNCGPIP